MKKSVIAELLHRLFSEDAIRLAAVGEQLEDINYCTKHKMNHLHGGVEKAKWEKVAKEADALADLIEKRDRTYTVENMRYFQTAVNDYLKQNPKARLLSGLTETEQFAVRSFYYYNCY